jgi:hypothetical protein
LAGIGYWAGLHYALRHAKGDSAPVPEIMNEKDMMNLLAHHRLWPVALYQLDHLEVEIDRIANREPHQRHYSIKAQELFYRYRAQFSDEDAVWIGLFLSSYTDDLGGENAMLVRSAIGGRWRLLVERAISLTDENWNLLGREFHKIEGSLLKKRIYSFWHVEDGIRKWGLHPEDE